MGIRQAGAERYGPTPFQNDREAIMDVCVVGLGKIGLPLAVQIATKGHRTRGADIDDDVVAAVTAGKAPFPGEAELDWRLREVVDAGHLTATSDTTGAVELSEVVVVVVPLLLDDEHQPDFAAIDAATRDVAAGLQPDTLISFETTLPVGTTRGRLAPVLVEASELVLGEDLHVCHSPERVSSGRVFADLRTYPKLVGGTDAVSTERGVEFYGRVLDFDPREDLDRPNGPWNLGSVEAAELTKLVETTYRDVNIALANEFAVLADRQSLNVYDVIEAANSQPFSHVHRPGIAVGGHCIPVYPRFYLAGHPDARLPAAAREVNLSMPAYAVSMLRESLTTLVGRRVAVLGASYRGGVKETAFSGVFGVVDELHSKGATPVVHDPLYTDDEIEALNLTPYHFGEPADAAILQADHEQYRELAPADLPGIKALVDGRRHVNDDAWSEVPRHVIGAPAPRPSPPTTTA